jgi:hypothetical protein
VQLELLEAIFTDTERRTPLIIEGNHMEFFREMFFYEPLDRFYSVFGGARI